VITLGAGDSGMWRPATANERRRVQLPRGMKVLEVRRADGKRELYRGDTAIRVRQR
jgi:hypothetical protein